MNKIISNRKIMIFIVLIFILSLAIGLRLYKLGEIPPPLNWDEAANGYNAFTIANWGRDEYGKYYPLYFKSFGDDKRPVHIYVTAVFVKFLGLTDFSVRLPAAVFGIFNVVLVYLLGRILFKSNLVGLIAAFFLSISPYALQYSRFNQELVFTMFLFMTGIFLFFKGLNSRNWLLSLSFFVFGISLLGYQSALVVVPPMVFILIVLYFNNLLKLKKYFIFGTILLGMIVTLFILNPPLLGGARMKQTGFYNLEVKNTTLYVLTKNELLGRFNKTLDQYLTHFSWEYLFVSGDRNARHSTQVVGEFYKIDLLFLLIGFFALLWKRSKVGLVLLSWALLGPLPASAVGEVPHASRAMFMYGSWHLIAAFGLYTLINLGKKYYVKLGILVASVIVLTYMLVDYLDYYYSDYSKKYAIEWQYGMKDIVNYVKENTEYNQVFMTEDRHQPYIFFAFYLNTPLPEYLSRAVFNRSNTKDFSTVSYFDRYYFGGWDPIESMPLDRVLYVLTPNQYSGLKHRLEFDVKRIVKYLDGGDAFYLVSAKK